MKEFVEFIEKLNKCKSVIEKIKLTSETDFVKFFIDNDCVSICFYGDKYKSLPEHEKQELSYMDRANVSEGDTTYSFLPEILKHFGVDYEFA